jgi:parvulin-like peptidyl-prolyl isomerase
MFTNNQTALLKSACAAIDGVDRANVTLAFVVVDMVDAGFKPEWFDVKSEHIDDTRKAVANAALSEDEYAIWSDESLAQKTGKGDKRELTPRGKLVKLVDERIRRLKKALSEPAAKGPKGNAPRDINARIRDEIAKLRNAVVADKDGALNLNADHDEMIAAFQRVLDLVPEKKVTPNH